MDRVWLDDKIVLRKEAKIFCFEEGVLYGQGLFETMRCYNARVFGLKEHLRRLRSSCPYLGIKVPSEKILEKAVDAVIKKNDLKNAALRLNVSKNGVKNRIFVFPKRFVSLPAGAYQKGFSARLLKGERISASFSSSLKTFNHYFYQRLVGLAKEKRCDEVFFLNGHGDLVEGSRTNIFCVKNNVVMTPDLKGGCLPGVTRAIVLGLLKRRKVKVRERRIAPNELFAQDEIFVTNSLIEVMPVTRLGNRRIGLMGPGPLTQEIRADYKMLVEKECQIR
jgi:branched-chain amino acid aminotransferase